MTCLYQANIVLSPIRGVMSNAWSPVRSLDLYSQDPLPLSLMKKTTITLLMVLPLLLGGASISWGDDFQRGLDAVLSEDYATALREWQPLAEQGSAKAQFNLGVMYDEGQGVQQDYEAAAKWYKLAAEQGVAKAQFNLGVMYDEGQGVQQDYEVAAKWYRLAAEQWNTKAQFNLGMMHDEGRGVQQDYEAAAKWYRLAAEQGHVEAQFNLAVVYDEGQGVQQDYEAAVKWYKLAAEQGFADAQYGLGEMYKYGLVVPHDYEAAEKWFRLAAEQGLAKAQYILGRMYRYGRGVPQNYETAEKWFRLAADQRYIDAQLSLDAMHHNRYMSPKVELILLLAFMFLQNGWSQNYKGVGKKFINFLPIWNGSVKLFLVGYLIYLSGQTTILSAIGSYFVAMVISSIVKNSFLDKQNVSDNEVGFFSVVGFLVIPFIIYRLITI